ncbi:PA14 domain-containing protein [Luteolibacter sp. GHJ8]|uniref:PA14 domain-containing protein n=1 Tax=Luteolibacter rhizosphaerae TaxID=2989719 RepID=A0ABT3FZW5_9BACT|nr:PA14 domain-containing protein [Luteolibacter rhizosphaerae]MCW1912515.1 PA14 domain-containing protein [Luteolibacter rhizosphaerae]
MLFLNPWLLAGLAGVGIPIIIHLVRRQAAKPIEWGAMRFLFDTVAMRRRKMEWEDLLLMAARCLLLALIALALARPFVPPDSSVPWLFVLPAALVGVALLGASFVLAGKIRWILKFVAVALLLLAAGLVFLERSLNLKRFEASGRRDVALVIDASASMELSLDGRTVFSKAVEEAKQLVKEAPRGTAFLVVLGGPAPEAKTAAPLTHRADVLGVLDSLRPVGGTFRAHEALGMATLGLAEGSNASKEIIVFTDAQRGGWRFDSPNAWDGLGEAWQAMPAKPKLVLRDFGSPAGLRNVALASLETSRSVVGTDREVTLKATVENTGTAPVTPGPVVIEIDGNKVGEKPVGLLVAGQKETVEFRHRFAKEGPRIVAARMEARDDLAADDKAERVVNVRGKLPILLVDGNPAGSFFERASGYSALALAPSPDLRKGKGAGDSYLMDPEVVPAPELTDEDLDGRAVVVLADVPRLPERLASLLAGQVADGTGLLVIAGPRSEAAFFNNWKAADGPLLPLPIGHVAVDPAGISPSPATFLHESVALFKDEKNSDLSSAKVKQWRKTGEAAGGVQAAAYLNGDPFLAAKNYGNGRTMLATCAFDARSGNLPALRAFVPLLHELVTWTAGTGVELNVDPSWSPSVAIHGASGGLTASYYRNQEWRGSPTVVRVDPGIDFRWGNDKPMARLPNDRFSVEWRGQLVPPMSGEYVFSADVDDEIEIRLGDHAPLKADYGTEELGRMTLEGNAAVPFHAKYREDGGEAKIRLFWNPPGGEKQIIPGFVFRPEREEAGEPMRVLDPQGLVREARLKPSRRGRELAIGGPSVPGVYQVSADEDLNDALGFPEGSKLPVAVLRDSAESHFEPRNQDDLSLIRKHADLLLPASVEDILGVLQGKGFGREIWKLLAIAAFILFLLESVFARWVSRSRRMAEDVRVSFGDEAVWGRGLK